MKTLLFTLTLLLAPLAAFAQTDAEKIRAVIEAQASDPNSVLQKQITSLIQVNNLPAGSRLQLAGMDLMQKGNEQTHHDCAGGDCIAYERVFYRQVSDIRWRSNDGSQMKVWVIGIYGSIFRAWDSDPSGARLRLRAEDTRIDSVIFL